ncbi:YdeI family protein [Cyclobacterium sediminis]
MNPEVDFYFKKSKKWQKELILLRSIILDFPLSEELKWGVPCYTWSSNPTSKASNILLIHEFKEYCALLFFKGVLLNDPDKILVQQTENVQAARQIRFTGQEEVLRRTANIKSLISEAIAVEEAGLKVPKRETKSYEIVEEFQLAMDNEPNLLKGFQSLSPGRQRAYLLYFSSAKQSKTRLSRIDKYKAKIINGQGKDD